MRLSVAQRGSQEGEVNIIGTKQGDLAALKAAHRTARLVVSAMMGALVFYVVIVEFVSRIISNEPLIAEAPVAARYGLYAIAVTMVFLTQVVRGVLTRATSPDEAAFAARMVQVSVVTAALSEIPAIIGLCSFFIWHGTTDFYLMSTISAYLFFRHFPRWPGWERLAGQRIVRPS